MKRIYLFILFLLLSSFTVRVLNKRPHDIQAFTQGLAIQEGILYESTGLYGQSRLKQIDLQTGKVLNQAKLPNHLFGEGIALFNGKVIQLTWQEQTACIYSQKDLKLLNYLPYRGQGWGLCCDGEKLFMSDGSNVITVRDPHTFAIQRRLYVHQNGKAYNRLNDLEVVDGFLYANVYYEDIILCIDKTTGAVVATIDASDLLAAQERQSAGVLNGIAYDADRKTFFITGKNWPWIFEAVFVKDDIK